MLDRVTFTQPMHERVAQERKRPRKVGSVVDPKEEVRRIREEVAIGVAKSARNQSPSSKAPRHLVCASTDALRRIWDTAQRNSTKSAQLGRKTGISHTTWNKLRRHFNKPFTHLAPDVFNKLVAHTRLRHEDLLYPPALLLTEDYVTSLKHSSFLAHDAQTSTDPALYWWPETVKFTPSGLNKRRRGPDDRLSFRTTVTNPWGVEFRGLAATNASRHFVMSVIGRKSDLAFDAVFTEKIEDVLCGLWIGVSRQAVYRMLLSPKPLTRARVELVCSELMDPVLELQGNCDHLPE